MFIHGASTVNRQGPPIPRGRHGRRSTPYVREHMIETIIFHTQMRDSSCLCGFGKHPSQLGLSHAEHVMDVYETTVNTAVSPRPARYNTG